MTRRHRLLVVDDHALFRRGLIALLSGDRRFEVVGEAGDATEAQRRAEALAPDLILLDNHMPGVTGVQALPDLRRVAPQARILMLTVSEDQSELAAALRAGAHGYLLKTLDSDALFDLLWRTLHGESVVSPEMTSKLVHAFQATPAPNLSVSTTSTPAAASATAPQPAGQAPAPLATLSPRQVEILRSISRGSSNKVIARELDIAETTVKIHVQQILRKLDVSTRVQAALYARDHGLE